MNIGNITLDVRTLDIAQALFTLQYTFYEGYFHNITYEEYDARFSLDEMTLVNVFSIFLWIFKACF